MALTVMARAPIEMVLPNLRGTGVPACRSCSFIVESASNVVGVAASDCEKSRFGTSLSVLRTVQLKVSEPSKNLVMNGGLGPRRLSNPAMIMLNGLFGSPSLS